MGEGKPKSAVLAQDEAFARRLRRVREEAGLSQEGLAIGTGRSPIAADGLERGRRKRPHPHTVRTPADASGPGEVGRSALLAAVPTCGKDAGATSAAKDAPEHARSGALPDPATLLVGRAGEVAEVAAPIKGSPADACGAKGIGWMLLDLGLRRREGQAAPRVTRTDPTSRSAVR